MAAPTIYRSSDASAPTLNGTAGSLIAVLDACLVNGYGSQTALGWGKPFSGTNQAVYRAASGARHYLQILDDGTFVTSAARNFNIRGYETMSAVTTGTNPFPSVTQAATPTGQKSSTLDSVARPWLLVGDALTFYMFISTTLTNPPSLSTYFATTSWGFGEIESFLTGDLYRTFVIFSTTDSTTVAPAHGIGILVANNSAGLINLNMPRSYVGTGGSIWGVPVGNPFYAFPGSASIGTIQSYPNPVDGGFYANALLVQERGTSSSGAASGFGIRGRMRGMLQQLHQTNNFNDQELFSGSGDFAGRTFMVIKTSFSAGLAIETTAWASSS